MLTSCIWSIVSSGGYTAMRNNPDLLKSHSLIFLFKSFCFLAVGLGVSAVLLFYGVRLMIGDNPYRAVVHINMFIRGYELREIDKQPLPYLLAIVLVSSVIGALWMTFIAPKYARYLQAQILVLPWISVIITSPIWGIIWSINLRSPQYFVEHFQSDPKAMMWLFYRTDAMSGLTLGWLSAIQSFPINLLSYLAFCSLLLAGKKLLMKVNALENRA
jgi:hypothetical protein